ncbi:hypothetical protein D922_03672 [Enterococcus faecalis 06-MB-DW-09]|nr:hypothetical protein D922_03672 [Enterococcus faecalis 06-MB-DW-09]
MKQETGMNAFFENVCCSLTSGRKIHIRKAFFLMRKKEKRTLQSLYKKISKKNCGSPRLYAIVCLGSNT